MTITTYKAIKFMIENASVEYDTANQMIMDAYNNRKIDGQEYKELKADAIVKFVAPTLKRILGK